MKHFLPLALLMLFTANAVAQLVTFPVKGRFYVSVDDSATVFVNGRQLFKASLNESASPETLLEPGDRVVARMHNKGGPKRFAMIFVSSDQNVIISFRNEMCKILPDAGTRDFTAQQFAELTQFAEQAPQKQTVRRFAYKNNAEFLWGRSNPCALGAIIKREYFKALSP